MPTVNIFYTEAAQEKKLDALIAKLKTYIAAALSCGEKKLSSDEISIRLIRVGGRGMLGSVEVEITAHAFAERVKQQDAICLDVADYIKKENPLLGDVKVWLLLCELGHSWKE